MTIRYCLCHVCDRQHPSFSPLSFMMFPFYHNSFALCRHYLAHFHALPYTAPTALQSNHSNSAATHRQSSVYPHRDLATPTGLPISLSPCPPWADPSSRWPLPAYYQPYCRPLTISYGSPVPPAYSCSILSLSYLSAIIISAIALYSMDISLSGVCSITARPS